MTGESVKVGNKTSDTYSYEYDDYGNRSKMTATGTENHETVYEYSVNGKYTALLQKETKTVEDENALKLQDNVKQTFYTYDSNGNQVKKVADGKTETNTYDGLNQLIGFTDGETTASYKYNASGLRYEKTVDGQTINHVWDGSKQIIADVIDNQFYEADCYIRGTNLVAKYNYRNGDKSEYTYYTQNAHGDAVNITDKDGKVTKKYTYDAFGVEKNIDENDTNAFRYCGEYFDDETGTIYLRARYYNPSTGRFISRDSFAGNLGDPLSLNLYTYCSNNPIFYNDPTGHKKGDTFKTIDEAAKDFAINYNPKSIENKIEYATTIYKIEEKVTTTHYFNLSEFLGIKKEAHPILYDFFSNVKTTSTKKVTMYTYTDINKGEKNSSDPPWAPLFHRKSAVAHTHGAYDPKILTDVFSDADLEYSFNNGVPIYVATPLGTLRKYDPNNYVYGEDNSEEIYDDIPYDPNHPKLKNKNNNEKNKLLIIVPFILIILIIVCLNLFNKSEQVQPFSIKTYEQEIKDFSAEKIFGYIRCMGNVNSASIAKKYALEIWLEVYGESVLKMKPYKVYWDNENNAWLVTGTLKKNLLGGIPYIIFSKNDGEIIAVWHTI